MASKYWLYYPCYTVIQPILLIQPSTKYYPLQLQKITVFMQACDLNLRCVYTSISPIFYYHFVFKRLIVVRIVNSTHLIIYLPLVILA